MVKKIIIILVIVLILALGGLTIYVSNLDWNTYRDDFADKISRLTGKKIDFSGNLNVSLFPHAKISAQNIKILNPNNGEELVAIDNMEADVSLSSLIKGSPQLETLSIDGAEIWFKINKEGKFNWEANQLSEDSDLSLMNFTIRNVFIHYQDVLHDFSYELSETNADVEVTNITGPYRLDGNFVKDKDHFGIALSVGNLARIDNVPLNIAITHPNSESYLRYDGIYNTNENVIKGDFSGGSEKTADFLTILSGITLLEDEYNVPLRFSLAVETTKKDIKLSSFVIKYADYIEGAGNLIIPITSKTDNKNVEVNFQLVNLDLRPLFSALKAEFEQFKNNGGVYKPNTELNYLVDVSAERIILNDSATGYMENLTIKGDWTDNVLHLEDFYAACIGNIILRMSGSLMEENQIPQYYLKVSLSGQNLLAFLNSLELNVQSLVQSSYRNIDLNLSINGDSKQMSSEDIKLSMDKMQVKASSSVVFGEHPSYKIKVDVSNANWDNYFERRDAKLSVLDGIRKDFEDLGFLKDYKINAEISASNIIFRGVPVEQLVITGNTIEGTLYVEKMEIDNTLDAKAKFNGNFSGLGTGHINIDDLTYDISGRDIMTVQEKINIPLPDWKIFKSKKFHLNGTLKGDLAAINISSINQIDDVRLEYNGSLKQSVTLDFDGNADLKTTNFSEFVNNLGGNISSNGSTKGVLNCHGDIKGKPKSWEFNNAECLLGTAKYEGNASIKVNRNNYEIVAKLNASDIIIDNYVNIQPSKTSLASRMFDDNFISRPAFNKDTFSFDFYKKLNLDVKLAATRASYGSNFFEDIKVHILNDKNLLDLQDLSFTYDGIDVAGNIKIKYDDKNLVQTQVTLKNIDLSNIGGKVYMFTSGLMNLTADITAEASTVDEFMNRMKGNIRFSADSVKFKGLNLNNISADLQERKYSKGVFQIVRDNLETGETYFDTFDGSVNVDNGVLTFIDTKLSNNEENVEVGGKVGLGDWKMNNSFTVRLKNLADTPQFYFSLSGIMNKPVLDVNVEDIARKYDEFWKQEEEKEQERKNEEQQKLNDAMYDAQEKVSNISDILNGYIPIIENYINKSDTKMQKGWYQEKLNNLQIINKDLDTMQAKAHVPNFTEDDIQKINASCEKYEYTLNQLKIECEKQFENIIEQRLIQTKTSTDKIYEDSQKMAEAYQQMVDENFDILLQIDAAQYMINNPELKTQQKQMSELNDKFIAQYNRYISGYNEVVAIKDMEILENRIIGLQEEGEEFQNLYAQLEKINNETTAMLSQIVTEQQRVFAEKEARKAAARKKELEEDADNLLKATVEAEEPSVSEEVVTVAPSLISQPIPPTNIVEDEPSTTSTEVKQPIIKVNNGRISAKETQVRDTSSSSSILKPISEASLKNENVSGTLKTNNQAQKNNSVTSSSGILKTIDGDVVQKGGTIVVK